EVVRGDEGVAVYVEQGLEVGAGIRQPTASWAADRPGERVLEPAFMQIRQAVATSRGRHAASIDFLRTTVDELTANGFVAAALTRAGHTDLV
ncbi:MAG TPA: ABC transporter substrate-binding protein, partial [Nocardioides sp.]